MSKVVIVGGGISGLSLAYRLQQRLASAEIAVLEQSERLGGTVWTERRDGFQVEIGPNGFLDNKPTTAALCRDLGLADRLVPASEESGKNRYLLLDGRLRLLPRDLGSLLTSDLLSWSGKLNLLAELFRRRRRHGGDESIDAFVRRRCGEEAANLFADAMVTGIFGGDPKLLSVPASFPRLVAFEQEFGSVIRGVIGAARRRRAQAKARGERPERTGRMWSFRPGLRLLIESLVERLDKSPIPGVAVRRVERAAYAHPAWIIRGDGDDHWHADVVVLTCPAYRQAALLADLDADLADRIGGIPYNRIAVVALGYRRADLRRPLDGFGFIAPQATRRDLLGVQWCSSIFPERAPEGMVLMRALCGGWHRPEVPGWSDDRLLAAVRAELKIAQDIDAEPVFHHIVRWDRAIPQYQLGHLDRLAWIDDRLKGHPGLFLGGNSYRGVALNDCTEQAEILAAKVALFLEAANVKG